MTNFSVEGFVCADISPQREKEIHSVTQFVFPIDIKASESRDSREADCTAGPEEKIMGRSDNEK